jgi:hypothetical protein
MTYDVFANVLGSVFTAFLSDSNVAYLRLIKAEAFGAGATAAPNSPVARAQTVALSKVAGARKQMTEIDGFSLQFSVRGPMTEQGTFLLDHGTLGRMALFLVPGQESASAIVIPAQPATSLSFTITRF